MQGIGIIGYAAPSPTGIIVRELRQALGITEQFAIYDYSAGGFDNKWAEGVFAGGFPRSGNFNDRWDWEIRKDELDDWIKGAGIKAVVLVGNTFGENTVKWIKDWNLPVIFVGIEETGWPADADKLLMPGISTSLPSGKLILLMPWPIEGDSVRRWMEEIRP